MNPDNRAREDSLDARYVVVHTEWNGWRTAVARLCDLEDVHWSQPKGAPRPLIHAAVPAAKLISGTLPPAVGRRETAQPIQVCVLKCHTPVGVFETLVRLADTGTGTAVER